MLKMRWLVPGLLIVACVIALFVPFVSPYARYPVHYVRCGGPPILATDFAAAFTYRLPGDDGYGPDPFTTDFFCTEGEAQAARFQRAR